MAKGNFTPGIDASLGLIFRLNILWQTIDRKAMTGDLEGWSIALDRVYCNLLYRNNVEIEYKDKEKNKIKNISLCEEDSKIFYKFKEIIKGIKLKRMNALRNNQRGLYNSANQEYYEALTMKDVWLRKLMQAQKLYLKEVEFNTSRAILGG